MATKKTTKRLRKGTKVSTVKPLTGIKTGIAPVR